MKAKTVEIVFVIDSSESMKPCFEGLAAHFEEFLNPLQGFNFRVRVGLLAMKTGRSVAGGLLVDTATLAGGLESIYETGAGDGLFTESPKDFVSKLRGITLAGDEHNLMALDMALDFPFGPVSEVRRVIAVFSDEPIEQGSISEQDLDRIPELIQKISARRVLLFAAMPSSPALDELGATDGCEIQPVIGGDGLRSVDFGKLLKQMAKSVSVTSLQGSESPCKRGLFGQEEWFRNRIDGSFAGMR